jgi:hypothetical protein
MNLNYWYSTAFVQNEVCHKSQGSTPLQSYHMLEHTPVTAGTLTGRVNRGIPGQNFYITAQGCVIPQPPDIGLEPYIIGGTLNRITGEMRLNWSDLSHRDMEIIVSYEYDMEVWQDRPQPNKPKPRTIDSDWQTSAGWVYNDGEWQAICPNS